MEIRRPGGGAERGVGGGGEQRRGAADPAERGLFPGGGADGVRGCCPGGGEPGDIGDGWAGEVGGAGGVGRRGEVGGVGGAGEIDHARGTPDIVCPVTQRDSSDWGVSAVRVSECLGLPSSRAVSLQNVRHPAWLSMVAPLLCQCPLALVSPAAVVVQSTVSNAS